MTALQSRAARPEAPATTPYGHLSPADRYIHETRDKAWLALLQRHGVRELAGPRILELGCGEGSLLRTLLHYGARPDRLAGIDIDANRVGRARTMLPAAGLATADAASLPYRDGTFAFAFAFTSFTSMLDAEGRRRSANEALRVLRPGGLLVIYDFWINPLNRRVSPLSATDLRELFAPRPVEMERVTLAPPIVRALGGRPSLCAPFERMRALRTHLLAAVLKEELP